MFIEKDIDIDIDHLHNALSRDLLHFFPIMGFGSITVAKSVLLFAVYYLFQIHVYWQQVNTLTTATLIITLIRNKPEIKER